MEKIAKIDGRILTVANGDLGNNDTSYTYFNLAREGYLYFSLIFTITATTLTLEVANATHATTDANATWVDVTTSVTGSANATADGSWILDTPVPYSRFRIKRVTTHATNALTLDLVRTQ